MPAPKANNTQLQQDHKMLNQMTYGVDVFVKKVNELAAAISPNNSVNIGGISPGELGRFLTLYESMKADITSLQTTVTQLTSSQSSVVAQSAQILTRKINEMHQSLNGVKAEIERYNQMNLRQPGATRQTTQTSPSPQRRSSPQKQPISRGNNSSAAFNAKLQAGSIGKKYFTDLTIKEKVKEIQKMQRAKNIKEKMPHVPRHKP